jgi:dipeptidyl aminopeptidase/acylaminoacyl peptidase
MQDDVTDGVKWLIAHGQADASHVCIVGASYGGFAALAGAALTPELYRCAASINGVTDLPSFIKHIATKSGSESERYRYVIESIGPPTSDKVEKRSPARLADNIRIPILLIHGAEDTVVPIDQSERMQKALKKLDRPHVFVKLPGEDHWLSRSETRLRVLKELETFLSANL